MKLNTYFSDFLADIRLQQNHRDELKTGHKTLRKRLWEDEDLSKIIVNTFLQGSYRRATAIRPHEGKRADVDIVLVTTIPESTTPEDAMALFKPFLDKYYKGKWELQGRSIGISMSYVDLDLVITSAPSETDQEALKSASVSDEESLEVARDWRLVPAWVGFSERWSPTATELMLKRAEQQAEWKLQPLRIPDRDAKCWQSTHPLEQIKWTRNKNADCNCHYVNVVKALKWCRRVNYSEPKYPKGYPLEHLIGIYCPDKIESVAEGVTLTLESIVDNLADFYAAKQVPVLPDHGVAEHDVWHRITVEDFTAFYEQIRDAAKIARRALDDESVRGSALAWIELFGKRFPEPPEEKNNGGNDNDDSSNQKQGGFTPRVQVTTPGKGRYA